MFNYEEEIRKLRLEKMALSIADGISCVLGFAQYYYEHGCLTVESMDAIYSKFQSDPFAKLQMTDGSDDELNDLLYKLRVQLKSIPSFNSKMICEYFQKYPDYMNSAADSSCEVYKHLKQLVNTHYNLVFN